MILLTLENRGPSVSVGASAGGGPALNLARARRSVCRFGGPRMGMKTLFCALLLTTCLLAIFGSCAIIGSPGNVCSGNQRPELRTTALSWTFKTFPTTTLALRGGTDWSDDSAGVTRARLRMKKPEVNVTETGNTTEANDSGS